MATKILFTGGYGFVGRGVIPLLRAEGMDVSTIDILNGYDLSKEVPVLDKYDVVVHARVKLIVSLKLRKRKKHFLM